MRRLLVGPRATRAWLPLLAAAALLPARAGGAGSLAATVPQLCGRCLAGFDLTVSPSIEARFVPSPTGRGDEQELGADDLETDVYDQGTLDLSALLETETSLALPMKPLCREECRGLCPICGENRNTTACACQERAPELRWEPLKAWAARQSR